MAIGNGDMLLVNQLMPANNGTINPTIEAIGSVNAGIEAVGWCPDEQSFIIATGAGTLVQMSDSFDILNNQIVIDTCDTGEEQMVNVGWGKKETQFHGSLGKTAAQEPRVDASGLSSFDDKKVRLAWREDGEYFACSTVDQKSNVRKVRIFNREMALQSVAEKVACVEPAIAFRSSGHLFAGVQRYADRQELIFYERNGLRHGEFNLRLSDSASRVVNLSWNSDCSILAVHVCDIESSIIQVWTVSNYHWSLKMVLPCRDVSGFMWDLESTHKLHVIASTGQYLHYQLSSSVFKSTQLDVKSLALVAQVDGCDLKVTSMKKCKVPPPMSQYTQTLSAQISCLSFNPFGLDALAAVQTIDGQVSLWDFNNGAKQVSSFKCQLVFRQMAWLNETTILGLHDVQLVSISLDGNVLSSARRPHAVRLVSPVGAFGVYAVFGDGLVERVIQNDDSSISFDHFLDLPEPSHDFAVWNDEYDAVALSLSTSSSLYVNEKLVKSNVTSFHIHGEMLIYTTTSHTAHFVALAELKALVMMDKPLSESSRVIEHGATIVTSIPGDVDLILQLPRGNLEVIAPRPMVLATICNHLESLDYKSALSLCRKHRIDMNLLFDFDANLFMQNLEAFVTQVQDVDRINLFISALKDGNIAASMYGNAMVNRKLPEAQFTDKVNSICDNIRDVMERTDKQKFMHAILTSYVRKSPPDLEPMLTNIRELRLGENGTEQADKALQYIIVFVDVEHLFNVALGMYDLELVAMVAQHSNKDPREYLPFLLELQKMEGNYRKFKIDDHLSNHQRALDSLARAGDDKFPECVRFVKDHTKLFAHALTVFAKEADKYVEIMTLFAESLMVDGNFGDAASAFMAVKDVPSAIDACKKALKWQELFAFMYRMKCSSEDIKDCAEEIVEDLLDSRRFNEAATVSLEYGDGAGQAIRCFLLGRDWASSIRLAYTHGLDGMIESAIEPAVLDRCEEFCQEIQDFGKDFNRKIDRLVTVRLSKTLDIKTSDETYDIGDIDAMSDTTSMQSKATHLSTANTWMSGTTMRSGKSGKSRRKQERKKASGKEGSPFEEDYLVESLRKMFAHITSMRTDTASLVSALISLGKMQEALQCQQLLDSMDKMVEKHRWNIFKLPAAKMSDLPPVAKTQIVSAIMQDGISDDLNLELIRFHKQVQEPPISRTPWKSDLL